MTAHSIDPNVKRLAMHVEDHPIDYGHFEGIIPKGEYGGGTVMLWDKGIWKPLDKNPIQAYEKGHLRFELEAEKLNGRWDLIRFKDEKHWFLIKYDDEYAHEEENYEITKALDKSVLSQQSMEEIAEHYQHVWTKKGRESRSKNRETGNPKLLLPKELKPSPYPAFIKPELATLVDKPPVGEDWIHEIKFDGYRILAFKEGRDVILKSRTNKDWTHELQSVAEAVRQLPYDNLVLDGEVVVLDKEGRSDFQLLQNSIHEHQQAPFIYYLFDLLYFEQFDLRTVPLLERKAILQNILSNTEPPLQYSDHFANDGKELFDHSCKFALEGIISKRNDSVYVSKRSKDWLKIKCLKRQEFIIGGYSSPKGGRAHFGALFLGVYNKEGNLDYTGNVGTGFSDESLKEIYQHLEEHESKTNPFTTQPPGATKAHWVKPLLVAEIEFTEWTTDGHLRHPSFKGLRFDKKPLQVKREPVTPLNNIVSQQEEKETPHSSFIITHPTKILYPEDNIRKQDLLTYYEEISSYILPFIMNRPLTLVRCPNNYSQCFYQRHYKEKKDSALHSLNIEHHGTTDQYIYLDNKEGLLNLVQMGVLEIHPWGSQISNIEHPDILVMDLDPAPDVSWKQIVQAALEIREHLAEFQLESFVKTTGGKGLHVVIPINPEYDWDDVKEFSRVFVHYLEQLKPEEYISKMTKAKRKGKIFIDYLRNQRTATAVSVYSTRARPHAPISTPLFWNELSEHQEDNNYTLRTLPQRLRTLAQDPWADFWKIKQSLGLDKL